MKAQKFKLDLFKLLLIGLTIFSVHIMTISAESIASTSGTITKCGLDTTAERVARNEETSRQAKRAKRRSRPAVPPRTYELRVIFHIITSSDGREGYVPLDSLVSNMDSANRVFSGLANTRGKGVESNIRVLLAGVTYTNNSDWFYNCADYATANIMKYATAVSPATTVNVWSCASDTRLGWVNYLPAEIPQWSVWNGLNLNYKGFPPSKSDPNKTSMFLVDYSDGDTFTHELGHYLGLLHTFGDGVNGCTVGDGVDDTPAEKTPASGKACREQPPRDTCPDQPGLDPVWNIMDYSDDTCTEEFTPGQIEVMRYSVEQYRNVLISNEPYRCVADGVRGQAAPMTICKSECFVDRLAPDGNAAPTQGWCRTDVIGTWGSCCCGDSCFPRQSVIESAKVLACGRVQDREEQIKPGFDQTQCLTANIYSGTRDAQVYLSPCAVSEFKRWAFNYDGSISSIGTSFCLAVKDIHKNATNLDGKTVGLEPCVPQQPNQKWSILPPQNKAAGTLSLVGFPGYCLDTYKGVFTMKICNLKLPTQGWIRASKPQCSSMRTLSGCKAASTLLGCACRWMNNKCIS